MIPYIGDFAEDATVYHYFNTFDSNDPSASVTVTNLIASDIFVYKDGSVTDIVTDGATVTIDFDSRTGLHLLTIDTSVHADYATGSDYMVMVNGVTVDGATLNAGIFTFSIENRYSAGALRPTTAGRTLDVNATGEAGIDLDNTSGTLTSSDITSVAGAAVTSIGANVITATSINADAITSAKIADGAFVAANFAASSLDGKGDWNTVVPDAAGVAPTAAEINAEVDTALADIGLDHLISSALPTNWATDVASGSVFDNIADDGTAVYDRTTDSLQAVRDHVGDGTNLTEAGGTGDQLTGITGVQLAADQAVDATKFGGAAVTATTSVTFPAASTVATTTGAVGSVTGAVGSVAGNVDGNVTGSVGSNLELGPAEVNAEVDTALATTTYAEPSGVPAATATLKDKIGYLYMALRNRVDVTATKKTFYDDADAAEWEKDLTDNGTTYSESEGNAI